MHVRLPCMVSAGFLSEGCMKHRDENIWGYWGMRSGGMDGGVLVMRRLSIILEFIQEV